MIKQRHREVRQLTQVHRAGLMAELGFELLHSGFPLYFFNKNTRAELTPALQACSDSLESFVLAAVLRGLLSMFLQTSNKKNVILCSATFYLYMNGKVLYL